MKSLFSSIWLAASALVLWTGTAIAQPVSGTRQINISEFKRYHWPTYRQVASKESVPEVQVIQFLLRNQGSFKGAPDGIFGAATARAVRTFQRKKKLKVDGIVGPQTWRPLLVRLRKGDRGDAVRALQTLLRETTGHEEQYLTRNLNVDGIFGSQTEEALRIAQDEANWFHKRAAVDGIAGPQIWSILLDGGHQP